MVCKNGLFSLLVWYERKQEYFSIWMHTARLLTGKTGVVLSRGGGGAVHNRKWHHNTPFSTPCGQTDTCENITLPQTSFAGGKYLDDYVNFVKMYLVLKAVSHSGHLISSSIILLFSSSNSIPMYCINSSRRFGWSTILRRWLCIFHNFSERLIDFDAHSKGEEVVH